MTDSGRHLDGESSRRVPSPIWLRLLGGVTALALLIVLGRQLSSSWSQVRPLLLDISPIAAALALALMALGETFVGVAWGLAMKSLGAQPSLAGSTAVHFASALGRAAPGMVATVAGRLALSEHAKVSRKIAGTGMLMELTLSATGALLIGIPAAITIGDLSVVREYSLPTVAAVAGLLILGGTVASRWAIPSLVRRWGHGIARPSGRAVVGLTAMYSGIWVVYGFAIVVVAESAGISMPAFWATGGIFALSWLLGFIVFFVPGGIGVREGALVLLLSPIVPNAEAVLVALIARVLWWLTTLLIATVGGLWLSSTAALERGRTGKPEA